MRKMVFQILMLVVAILFASPVYAQMMMEDDVDAPDHTAREEAEGKEIWGKLQAKELGCDTLSEDNYGAIGEYFMGVMMGDSHEAMNRMMEQMMGEEGEEAMHVVMGKRISGCDPKAVFAPQAVGFMPMMQMMMGGGGWSPSFGNSFMNNNMMNFGYGFGFLGWVFMVAWWVVVIAALVFFVKWLAGKSGAGGKDHGSSLDILKERYAKGEIDKKEFEEKKKEMA